MNTNKQNLNYNTDEDIIENEEELDAAYHSKLLYPIAPIKVDKNYYTIFELKRKYDRRDDRGEQSRNIVLDSDFQRDEVWKGRQPSELIESVLMGLPLPIFYFYEDKWGRLIVVDGRQRLTSLFDYMDDKFPLAELKMLPEFSKKKFSKLSPIKKQEIEDYQIIAHVIKPPTPDRIKFDIFDRVNRGGTQLNKQEIRNAMYQGNATKLLKKLKKTDEFKKATEGSFVNDKRMKSEYIILRFLSFYLLYNKKLQIIENGKQKLFEYKDDIDEMLGLTMDFINALSDDDVVKYENLVINALKNANYYFSQDAFRLTEIVDGKFRRYPININIFESMMYAMTLLPQENDELKEYVSPSFEQMKSNPDFRDSINNHRDSKSKFDVRYGLIVKIVEGQSRYVK